jgi:hypothetical protein
MIITGICASGIDLSLVAVITPCFILNMSTYDTLYSLPEILELGPYAKGFSINGTFMRASSCSDTKILCGMWNSNSLYSISFGGHLASKA